MTQLNWPTLAEEISRGTVRDPLQHFRSRQKRNCPLCGFTGYFLSAGARQEARCPNYQWKRNPKYVAGDIKRSAVANAIVDITALNYPDNEFDVIVCNHVLEHPKLLAKRGFLSEEILFSAEENERHRLAAEKVYVVRKPAAN